MIFLVWALGIILTLMAARSGTIHPIGYVLLAIWPISLAAFLIFFAGYVLKEAITEEW